MKKLSWPTAELLVAPGNGVTVANLKTLFHTTSASAVQTQSVTLLGQNITIEATPTSWTWHPGNGDASWTTSDPGEPYTEGADTAQLNGYTYDSEGTVTPSVDVTYSGRYRVNGGEWIDIPDTLTLTGDSVTIEVDPYESSLTNPDD